MIKTYWEITEKNADFQNPFYGLVSDWTLTTRHNVTHEKDDREDIFPYDFHCEFVNDKKFEVYVERHSFVYDDFGWYHVTISHDDFVFMVNVSVDKECNIKVWDVDEFYNGSDESSIIKDFDKYEFIS